MEPEKIIRQALGDKYDIQSVIGNGGMAVVYKAIQTSLNRPVALKVVHQNLVHDKEFICRFLREAQVCASLNHPNIVTIYDVGSVGTVHYISMEYLEGMTLRDLIRSKKSLDANEASRYIIPIAEVLSFIHRYGLIHRDVKSSNIFITKNGRAVLMDFGIVYSEEQDPLSRDGSVLGTPEYMSPEQAEGKLKIDGRSDIYSLGVILFECLTGGLPFHSDNYITTLHHVLHDSPPSLTSINTQIPKWISSIVAACLVKDRSLRIKDGITLANALRNKEKIRVPAPTNDPYTRKFTKEEIENSKVKEVNLASNQTGKNRNTVLMSLIITIAIIIIILGLLTFGPSQLASNNVIQPPIKRPPVTVPVVENPPATQITQPAVITTPVLEVKPDPESEKKATIRQEIISGDEFLNDNSFEAALSKYQNAQIIDPANSEIKQKIIQAKIKWIQSYIQEGDGYLDNKEFDNARSSYEEAKKIDPEYTVIDQKIKTVKNEQAKSYIIEGDAHLKDRDFELALRSYNSGIQIDPSNVNLKQKIKDAKKEFAQSFIVQGDAQIKSNDFDLAISNYNKAGQIDPDNRAINSKINNAEAARDNYKKQELLLTEKLQLEKNVKRLGINMIKVENPVTGNFYIGESEVTQRLWKEVMGSNPSTKIGDMMPVENVSYNDILNFLGKLNQMTKMIFRLPTEAEWEYAAKGGSKSQNFRYSGSDRLSEVSWYDNNSNGSTHTVMSLKKNEIGLYDMSGNVWEWSSTSEGDKIVLKGGCWLSPNNLCAITNREILSVGQKDYSTGFRLCRTE